MTWETALSGRLIDDTDVFAAIGNEIHWDVAPQGTAAPFLVLTEVSTVPTYDLDGLTTLVPSVVQFDCYSSDPADAREIRQFVQDAIAAPGTFDGVKFAGAFIKSVRTSPENTATGIIHRASFDARVWHTE